MGPALMQSMLFVGCCYAALVSVAAAHPRTLSLVKKDVWVGSLAYRSGSLAPRRAVSPASEGQRTAAVSLGEYVISVNVSGVIINAVIDTGSGITQVACKGVQAMKGYKVRTFDVSHTAPPVQLVAPRSSAACQMFCSASHHCMSPPALAGACEYKIAYDDKTYAIGRVYTGALTFPSSELPVDASFHFGCVYKASTKPYFFQDSSALFGMDWEPASLWSQLIAAKLVGDTMYLCLGNGGDGTKSDQSGVLVLGTDDAVSLPPGYPSEVVTATLVNPATNPNANYPPSMYLHLIGLSIGASPDGTYPGSKSLMGTGNTPAYYLIDTGTSDLLLAPEEHAVFIKAINLVLNLQPVADYYTDDYGQVEVLLNRFYTPQQLDALLPPVLFTFQGASGPVRLMPSNYMVYKSNHKYLINIGCYPHKHQGILGNAWMTGWLIQQTRSTLKLKMTRVKSCNDILY